ncbi:MAG: hypothetical protein ACK553_12155 [Planctomycetota bacterium]|jgi:hypothetical protein
MKASKVVNLAFLQELKESHSSLWEDVNLLGSYVQEPFCPDWLEQNGGGLLRRLREGLSSQYRLEETFGYVDGPMGETDPDIEKAIDQHLRIFLQCVALSEQCDDLEYAGRLRIESTRMWRQLRAMYESILDHEALERRIISRGLGLQIPHPIPTHATLNQPLAT